MTDEQFLELKQLHREQIESTNRLADETAQQNRVLEVIKNVLVPAVQVTKALELNKNTIGQNKKITKYQPIGQNRNYIKLGEAAFIQNNKTKAARRKLRNR